MLNWHDLKKKEKEEEEEIEQQENILLVVLKYLTRANEVVYIIDTVISVQHRLTKSILNW